VTDDDLVALARRARRRAYVPYSEFAVGAAVEGDSGQVYAGTNVENASYGLTCCAERVAVFTAVAAGERRLRRLAVAADSLSQPVPCGACRQVLAEFADDDLRIVTEDEGSGSRLVTTLGELLPRAFRFDPKARVQDADTGGE